MQLQTEPRLYIGDWEPRLYIGEWEPRLYIGEWEPTLYIGDRGFDNLGGIHHHRPQSSWGLFLSRMFTNRGDQSLFIFWGGQGGGGRGGRDEGDEDYGCVTIRFTWSPHQALLYSNGPLHQKSVFYSPLPLNSVKRLLMSLCSPEAMWPPPPQTKRKSPDSTLLRRKIKTAPNFFLPFSVERWIIF